jgi:hypothetical protein
MVAATDVAGNGFRASFVAAGAETLHEREWDCARFRLTLDLCGSWVSHRQWINAGDIKIACRYTTAV